MDTHSLHFQFLHCVHFGNIPEHNSLIQTAHHYGFHCWNFNHISYPLSKQLLLLHSLVQLRKMSCCCLGNVPLVEDIGMVNSQPRWAILHVPDVLLDFIHISRKCFLKLESVPTVPEGKSVILHARPQSLLSLGPGEVDDWAVNCMVLPLWFDEPAQLWMVIVHFYLNLKRYPDTTPSAGLL